MTRLVLAMERRHPVDDRAQGDVLDAARDAPIQAIRNLLAGDDERPEQRGTRADATAEQVIDRHAARRRERDPAAAHQLDEHQAVPRLFADFTQVRGAHAEVVAPLRQHREALDEERLEREAHVQQMQVFALRKALAHCEGQRLERRHAGKRERVRRQPPAVACDAAPVDARERIVVAGDANAGIHHAGNIPAPRPRDRLLELDLFYELAVPPGAGRSEAQVYADALAEIELADALGFHGAWLVEHHFMPSYSHSSKPELILAALARRTRRLRLGLGVIPLPYHHPVHVAERIATLDLLCDGRLEVGIGRGFSPAEYTAFGVAMADSRALVDETLVLLRHVAYGGPIHFAGRHATLDGVQIVPSAVQRPYPPLWTAAVSPETFDWAAREGLGVLAGPFKPWFMVDADLRRYRAAWRHAAPPRVGMTVGIVCLRDGARARRLAAPAFRWFYDALLRVTAPVLENLLPSYEQFHDLGRFRRLFRLGARLRVLELAGLALAGTPAECLARMRRYRDAGVTHLLLAVGAGALPTDVVRESLQCIAEDVLPALRAA